MTLLFQHSYFDRKPEYRIRKTLSSAGQGHRVEYSSLADSSDSHLKNIENAHLQLKELASSHPIRTPELKESTGKKLTFEVPDFVSLAESMRKAYVCRRFDELRRVCAEYLGLLSQFITKTPFNFTDEEEYLSKDVDIALLLKDKRFVPGIFFDVSPYGVGYDHEGRICLGMVEWMPKTSLPLGYVFLRNVYRVIKQEFLHPQEEKAFTLDDIIGLAELNGELVNQYKKMDQNFYQKIHGALANGQGPLPSMDHRLRTAIQEKVLTVPYGRFRQDYCLGYNFTEKTRGFIRTKWPSKEYKLRSIRGYHKGRVEYRASKNLCLFSHFDPKGVLQESTAHYLEKIKALDFEIVIITSSPRLSKQFKEQASTYSSLIIHRKNYGHKFASWLTGLKIFPLKFYQNLVLTSDQLQGPFDDLPQMVEQMQKESYDLWGPVESFEYQYHLQCGFLWFGKKIISSKQWAAFWKEMKLYESAFSEHVKCEIPLTQYFKKEGFKLGAKFRYADSLYKAENVIHNPSNYLFQ